MPAPLTAIADFACRHTASFPHPPSPRLGEKQFRDAHHSESRRARPSGGARIRSAFKNAGTQSPPKAPKRSLSLTSGANERLPKNSLSRSTARSSHAPQQFVGSGREERHHLPRLRNHPLRLAFTTLPLVPSQADGITSRDDAGRPSLGRTLRRLRVCTLASTIRSLVSDCRSMSDHSRPDTPVDQTAAAS
jgi:hypothetical protein